MKQASLIYTGVTILLALVDAIRDKVKWGKVDNINHTVSRWLGMISGGITIGHLFPNFYLTWMGWIQCFLLSFAVILIRLVFFDPLLNLFRIFFKINPTMRLDYVSTKTSSYEDQHSEKISFWQKRAIGIAGWFMVFLVYNKIF